MYWPGDPVIEDVPSSAFYRTNVPWPNECAKMTPGLGSGCEGKIVLFVTLPLVVVGAVVSSAVLLVTKRVSNLGLLGAGRGLPLHVLFRQQFSLFVNRLWTNPPVAVGYLTVLQAAAIAVSLVQVCLLPLFVPLRPLVNVLLLFMVFQARFVLDCLIQTSLFPLLAQLQLKRMIIRHTASQMLFASILLATMIVPLSTPFLVRVFLLILTVFTVVCQTGVGPFKFSLTLRSKDGPRVRSARAIELFHYSRMLQLVVSTALALNLSNPSTYAYCHVTLSLIARFLMRLLLLLAVCFLSFPLLPSYRSDQYRRLLLHLWGPLAGGLAWSVVFLKWWRGIHG